MAHRKRVVVIGGGIIGTACAHYLAEFGWQVTILDRGRFGGECSHANCGLVCPSHVLPLAEPGVVRAALGSLFRRDSPLAIRPRFDPALWLWLIRFARRCNHADMMQSARACKTLLDSSARLYRQLFESEPIDCEWETRGLLYVFRDRPAFDAYSRTDALLRESFGVESVQYAGNELTAVEPALKTGLAGGFHYGGDAHLRPDRLLASWRLLLEARGVEVREHSRASGFGKSGRRAVSVATSEGELAADAVVVAAGATTPWLRKELGCRIPIQPGKGYSITTSRPRLCPTVPLIFPETKVAVTPMQSGYRIGSTMEFAGYDATLDPRRLELLRRGATLYLLEPYTTEVAEEWFGWRPMTVDSLPIIDRVPRLENVLVAAGHNMLGLSMAPATGRLVAELLSGTPPHIDPSPFSLRRFHGF